MRRYDIISGILLILFIIDFALAAPVLVQEKRQACVYEVHIPRDLITISEKRGNKDLEKLLEYFNAMGRPVESSDTHESPSTSARPGPNHASTNVVQPPVPNPPGSSKAYPSPLMEPSSPSSTPSSDSEDYGWLFETEADDAFHKPLHPLTLSAYKPGLDHGLMGSDAPQPNLVPFTLSGYKPGLDHGLTGSDAPQPNLIPFTLSGYKPGLDHGLTGADAPQLNLNPNSKKRPLTDPDGPDPNFDESPPRPAKLPKESHQVNGYQMGHVQQPNLDIDLNQPPVPVSEEHPPLTSAQLQTDPELHLAS